MQYSRSHHSKFHRQHPLMIAALAILAMLTFGLGKVAADDDQALARKLRTSGDILPLEKIAAQARSIKPGELLETELEHEHGRYIYEVEILDKAGQVWELKLDARTAELLKLERDD